MNSILEEVELFVFNKLKTRLHNFIDTGRQQLAFGLLEEFETAAARLPALKDL